MVCLSVPLKDDEFIGARACKGCVKNNVPTLLWSKTLKRIDNVYDLVLKQNYNIKLDLKEGCILDLLGAG
jgi:hypothetical protein